MLINYYTTKCRAHKNIVYLLILSLYIITNNKT